MRRIWRPAQAIPRTIANNIAKTTRSDSLLRALRVKAIDKCFLFRDRTGNSISSQNVSRSFQADKKIELQTRMANILNVVIESTPENLALELVSVPLATTL